MLETRFYRVGLLPVALVLIVVAFSLQEPPRSVRTTLAADAFSGTRAMATLDRLADAYPVRRPGDVADDQLGQRVAGDLRTARFSVREEIHSARTIDGTRDLRLVIGERTGTSSQRIVVVAHRDAAGPGARAELSGTAALLELARVVGAPRRTSKTLMLVSTSGGSGGAAGAIELARQLAGQDVSAVLVLGALAADELRRPTVVPWSNGLGIAPLQLRRTVESALRTETGLAASQPRALSQTGRYAVPGTLGEQGPLVAAGLPAVLLSASGEAPPPADAEVSPARMQSFGRTALRVVTALDNGPAIRNDHSPSVVVQGKVIPAWAPRLLLGVLLLPPLLALVDAFARARRQRTEIGPWITWTLLAAVPFVAAALIARLIGLAGLLPVAPAAPAPISTVPAAVGALVGVALAGLLAAAAVRFPRRTVMRTVGGDAAAPGAAVGALLVLWAVTFVLWFLNPFSAALLIPALHVWLFALMPEFRPPRAWGLTLCAVLAVPAVALGAWVAATFGLDPVDLAWTALMSIAGGHASPVGWLLWSVAAGAVVSGVAIAWRGRAHAGDEDVEITMRGPRSYAGPGSLGGVESALRR
ncbi:MAG: M28 family peptidase [Solirubrobacteraceae bacterium]|nr:M28 family peptidase [Solirubrobacteraceae bacterium]